MMPHDHTHAGHHHHHHDEDNIHMQLVQKLLHITKAQMALDLFDKLIRPLPKIG